MTNRDYHEAAAFLSVWCMLIGTAAALLTGKPVIALVSCAPGAISALASHFDVEGRE